MFTVVLPLAVLFAGCGDGKGKGKGEPLAEWQMTVNALRATRGAVFGSTKTATHMAMRVGQEFDPSNPEEDFTFPDEYYVTYLGTLILGNLDFIVDKMEDGTARAEENWFQCNIDPQVLGFLPDNYREGDERTGERHVGYFRGAQDAVRVNYYFKHSRMGNVFNIESVMFDAGDIEAAYEYWGITIDYNATSGVLGAFTVCYNRFLSIDWNTTHDLQYWEDGEEAEDNVAVMCLKFTKNGGFEMDFESEAIDGAKLAACITAAGAKNYEGRPDLGEAFVANNIAFATWACEWMDEYFEEIGYWEWYDAREAWEATQG